MYKVYCDNTLMCDSRVEELVLLNPVIKLEENKAGSFSFILQPEHPYYNLVQRRKSIIQVYQDETELLFSGMCTEVDEDFFRQRTISCEGELSYFNDSIQRPARYQGTTVRGLLEAYVANHNAQVEDSKKFKVGQVTVTDSNDYISCYTNMQSTMKCLKDDLIDDLGGILRVRHENGTRYIDYLAESPNTCSQNIKLGKNLLDYKSNIDSTDIATAIIPLGKKLEESTVEGLETRLTIEAVNNGKDYVFSQDAVNTYGWISKTVEWDNVTTADTLKTKGEKYLAEIQFENVVIEAKAIDLHFANKEIESFKISDQIRVVSTPHGMDRYFRLTKMTLNLNNPEKNTITLGKEGKLTLTAKNTQANTEIKKAIEAISPNSIVAEAVANATQIIQSAMGGYITTVLNDEGVPKELLIMDTPSTETATKVWRWNINGLGYSSEGYNGTYALAMTMDGVFVADFIKAGTMYADRIKGGTLTLGGEGNINGVMRVLDSSGEEVGRWDKDGITLPSGTKIAWKDITGTDDVATKDQIPTKTSELKNDSNFATTESIPTKLSQLTNDSKFINAESLPTDEEIVGVILKNRGTIVTKEYIGTLKVVAGSVAAEDITGTTISGKTISGGEVSGAKIQSVDDASETKIELDGAILTTYEVDTGYKGIELEGDNIIVYSWKYADEKVATIGSVYNEEDSNSGLAIYAADRYANYISLGYRDLSNGINYSRLSINRQLDGAVRVHAPLHVDYSVNCATDLTVSGTKSRLAETENYNERLLYCYETPTPLFGDVGEGVIDDTGKCYVFLDDIFAETIEVNCTYQVFLQPYGDGKCYVTERTSTYFIVTGTENLRFGWEIKAVQKDYDTIRLEEPTELEEDTVLETLGETSVYLESLLYNVESEDF